MKALTQMKALKIVSSSNPRRLCNEEQDEDKSDDDYKVKIEDMNYAMDNITASVSKADRMKYENVNSCFLYFFSYKSI